jgi:hypothetical protein
MLFAPSDGNVMAIAVGATTTQVTINVNEPQEAWAHVQHHRAAIGDAKAVCS